MRKSQTKEIGEQFDALALVVKEGFLMVSEVILSALAGDWSVVDGMDWTMMIAAETTCAAAIIFPFGRFAKYDVTDRAYLRTFAAMGADVGIDGEFLVGYHEAVEVGPDDVTERPRRQA